MNANLRNFALWVIIVLLLLALFTLFQSPGQRTTSQDISFSELLTDVDTGRVKRRADPGPGNPRHLHDNRTFQTYAPSDPTLIQRLYNKGVAITARPQDRERAVVRLASDLMAAVRGADRRVDLPVAADARAPAARP